MTASIAWSPQADALILQLRAAGFSWRTLASELRVGRNSIIERARRLGLPPASRLAAPPRPVLERTERPPLPSGHPLSWQAITINTPLEGAPYPYPVYL